MKNRNTKPFSQTRASASSVHLRALVLLSLLILSAGIWIALDTGKQTDLRLRREFARQARGVAATILPENARALSFTAEDKDRPEFQRLCGQMRAYAEAAGIRSLYTLALRDGQLVFGPENLDPDDPYASPPGTVYEEPTEKDFDVFRTGTAMVQGPASDEYGSFITATAPLVDPKTGEVLMTVGIDEETTVWREQIRNAQWISLLMTLIPLSILLAGFFVIKVRGRLGPAVHKRLRHAETVSCAVIMLVLTILTTFLIYKTEKRTRDDTFLALAQTKAEVYTDALRDMRFSLNMMVNFLESSEFITREEFSTFCRPLIRNNSIDGCLWLPEIAGSDAEAFAAQIHATDLPGFTLRQLNGAAMPVPAEKSVLYPALYIEPLAGHEAYLGYDAASDPVWISAIDEAIRTDTPVATAPLLQAVPSGRPADFFVFQPASIGQQRGVVGIAVQLDDLFSSRTKISNDASADLDAHLFLLRSGEPPRYLSGSQKGCIPDSWPMLQATLHKTIPIFIFGKTYGLMVVPNPQWLAAHPLRNAPIATMIGILLTLLVTLLVEILSSRPALLEKLVQQRTADLLRLSTAIEQSPETVVITDPDGLIQYTNPAFKKISGYSREEVIGQNPRILKSGHSDEAFYSDLWKTITAGKIWEGRFINKRKNGEIYTEEASIAPVKDSSGSIAGYVAVKRDITDDLIKEEQFHQSQKMEAIGQLAGGVAHDFNNLLQAILGFGGILTSQLPPNSTEQCYAAEIQKAANKAAELTRQLLAFSRKQPMKRQRVNLNDAAQDAEVLLHVLLGETIKIFFDLPPDTRHVYADPGQITQIIMNLAINARDAMPDGGRLTIASENVTVRPEDKTAFADSRPGEFVCLSVTDTGCGMSPAVKERLFEPFFTTKGVGKGTGLGLAVVHGIVKQNNGWANVYSEENLGTTFRIYLPACLPDLGNEASPSERHSKRILLVEDDEDMRNMVVHLLKAAGHRPVATASAEEALQRFAEESGQFGLLFGDIVLPGKSGVELADELRAISPGLPILLCSGYRDQRQRWQEIGSKGYHFVQKPFTVANLLQAVQDALSETA